MTANAEDVDTGIAIRLAVQRDSFRLALETELPGNGVISIFGASGSGKTSLLRAIAGLDRIPGGYVRVNGEVWQNGAYCLPTHQRRLGFVFQEASLFPHLRVAANLNYGARRAKAGSQHLEQAIDLLALGPLLDCYPAQLSGGEQQRVAIARALATEPGLLLMDEPLSALDVAMRQEILPYLKRMHDTLAIPLLYVSHAPDEVAQLADYLLLLERGRMLAAGPLADILTRLDMPTMLGEEAGAVINARVNKIDSEWLLARVEFTGGELWICDSGFATGQEVRLRVLARDVSIATSKPGETSIQNILSGEIESIAEQGHTGMALLRLRTGCQCLLARLTRRAVAQLQLEPGRRVWLQIKSTALLK